MEIQSQDMCAVSQGYYPIKRLNISSPISMDLLLSEYYLMYKKIIMSENNSSVFSVRSSAMKDM